MKVEEFIPKSKELVEEYTRRHLDSIDEDMEFEVYVVWYSKTLQNAKAMLSTTVPDGMYYEVTFNGDKDEVYFDAYKKFENLKVNVREEG